jgi:hypothetical protein
MNGAFATFGAGLASICRDQTSSTPDRPYSESAAPATGFHFPDAAQSLISCEEYGNLFP